MKHFSLATVAVVLCSGSASVAATFSATSESSGCKQLHHDVVPGEAICDLAYASAKPGHLGVEVNSGAEGHSMATARFSDTLYFGIAAGTFTIPLEFVGTPHTFVEIDELAYISRGTANLRIHGGGGEIGDGSASNRFSFVSFKEIVKVEDKYTSEIHDTGSPTYKESVVLSFTDGQLSIFGHLDAQANCVVTDAICSALADYKNSLRFLGGTLRDLDGSIRNDVSIASDSGFDYRVGLPAHDVGIAPVPLPASAWLLGAGLLGLFGWKRRGRLV